MLATANTGKNLERFWKNAGEWTGGVEVSKEQITGSKHRLYTDLLGVVNNPLTIHTHTVVCEEHKSWK